MNKNELSNLQNKRSSTDSSQFGNGSVSRISQDRISYAYGAGAYPQQGAPSGASRAVPVQPRVVYDSAAGSAQRPGGQPAAQQPRRAEAYDAHGNQYGSTQNYRTNYGAAGGTGNTSRTSNGSSPGGNGSGKNGPGGGTKGSGSNGSGKNGSGNGKKPGKKKTFQQRLTAGLKRALRSIYVFGKNVSAWFKRLGKSFQKQEKPVRIFLASAGGFVLISIIVMIAVSGARNKREEAISAELPMATPIATVAPIATPEPTPSPTPEVRIEKGAEGEDVMSLQKRLMELNYLAIDEPTSYFGKATKAAVMLFQRQHELQQDGICGAETIALIYSEDAKPYVMYEGAEGDDIQSFQEQLVELGYLEDNQVTGYYGTDTLEAVTKFQQRNHLGKDGKAGEKTLEAINSPDARVSYTKEQEIIAEKKKQAALARASSSEGRIDKLINAAKKQLGDTYILGKSGPDSFDCSGLVVYCLRSANVYTRRLNAAGLSKTTSWTKVSSLNDVKRGDLLFFKSDDSSGIGHVGIYIGGGEMIDASSANGKVVRRGAKTNYWRRNFVVARRPIE
jgi:cell wall-associated NlpC family hydrolase